MPQISLVILCLIVVVFLYSSIKISSDSERFAVVRLGRYFGIKGPGLVFKLVGTDQFIRLKIGDRGDLIDTNLALIKGVQVPVNLESSVKIGSIVRIARFDGTSVRVITDTDQRRTITCEKCGHIMHS